MIVSEYAIEKNGKTKINCDHIRSIHGVFKFSTKRFITIRVLCDFDQHQCKVSIDSLVASIIYIRERASRKVAAKAQSDQFRLS